MTQQALSNGIRTWTRRGLKGAGVLLIPALALTAYSAVPTQGVILNDNPPAVPCVSGPCTYDPSNYSSARFVGAVANTAAELGDTIVQGDFNQDGLPDLAMGGPRYAGSRGLVQVVYGSAGGPTGTVDLGGSAVVTFFGKGTSSLGLALGAGDITDDGIVDLVIGAPDLSKVYIVPGSRTAWTSQTGSNGIENHPGLLTLTPSLTGSSFGSSLAVGDIGNAVGNAATSDGKVDLIVGAPSANSSKGAVYLIYGPITTSSSTIDAASNVFTFNGGNTGDRAGDTVAIFPSVTEAISANGIPDIGIGAPAANMTGGKVYLIEGRARDYFVQGYGSASGGLDVGLFRKRILVGDLTETATIKGGLGLAIAGIGDVNHDDFYDIAVGAPYAPSPTNTSEAGRVYVFFGSSSVLDSGTGPANLSTVVTPYLYGETTSDQLGSTIVGLNDLDGDAFDDFLVAARRLDIGTSSNDLGGVYAVSGRSTSSWGLTGKKVDGSRFQNPRPGDAMASAGPFNSYKGLAIAGGLDLDGDGHSDFFVGAPGSDVSGSGGQGRVYFISYGDYMDRDSDGQDRASGDCDDENNASRYRADGSGEVCDGFDNDCDGLTDEADPSLVGTAYYTDADLDGYGRNTTPVQACGPRSGLSLNNLDCDDASASTNPAAAEVCDGKDNDCDTAVDDADSNVTGRSTWYKDGDGDGYGTTTQSTTSCNKPSGYVSISTDCNDNNAAVNPGATESCDGIDNDCDNKIDANDNPVTGTSSYYPDGDGDGYGNSSASATAGCPNTPPTGQVTNRTDCNDSSAAIHPGAPEGSVNNSALSCLEGNGIDNDCDGIIDEGTCSSDDDNDGQTEAGGDCDDANPATYSGSTELCNGVNDDCDASIDEDFDQDNDGQLDATRCTGSGLSTATDCDDQDPSVYAGAPVQCDGKDTDCNGILPDSGYSSEADADNDATRVCDADCDDTDNTIYPSNTEICDEKDNDCNELIDDDAIDFETFYADTDGDQYGDSASTIEACDVPSSYSINDTDCDDSDNTIYPGAAPICDGDDHDCNGEVDLELPEFDGDSDGYLNAQLCTEIIDGEPLDCDDSNTDVHPLAEEVSGDGIDNNCDGVLSEGAVFEDAPAGCSCSSTPAAGSSRPGMSLLLLLVAGSRLFRSRRRETSRVRVHPYEPAPPDAPAPDPRRQEPPRRASRERAGTTRPTLVLAIAPLLWLLAPGSARAQANAGWVMHADPLNETPMRASIQALGRVQKELTTPSEAPLLQSVTDPQTLEALQEQLARDVLPHNRHLPCAPPPAPPEAFLKQVKDALDFVELDQAQTLLAQTQEALACSTTPVSQRVFAQYLFQLGLLELYRQPAGGAAQRTASSKPAPKEGMAPVAAFDQLLAMSPDTPNPSKYPAKVRKAFAQSQLRAKSLNRMKIAVLPTLNPNLQMLVNGQVVAPGMLGLAPGQHLVRLERTADHTFINGGILTVEGGRDYQLPLDVFEVPSTETIAQQLLGLRLSYSPELPLVRALQTLLKTRGNPWLLLLFPLEKESAQTALYLPQAGPPRLLVQPQEQKPVTREPEARAQDGGQNKTRGKAHDSLAQRLEEAPDTEPEPPASNDAPTPSTGRPYSLSARLGLRSVMGNQTTGGAMVPDLHLDGAYGVSPVNLHLSLGLSRQSVSVETTVKTWILPSLGLEVGYPVLLKPLTLEPRLGFSLSASPVFAYACQSSVVEGQEVCSVQETTQADAQSTGLINRWMLGPTLGLSVTLAQAGLPVQPSLRVLARYAVAELGSQTDSIVSLTDLGQPIPPLELALGLGVAW